MESNIVSRRKYNFRLLWLNMAWSLGFGLVNRIYRDALYNQLLAEGLSSKEVMESLHYNNSTGMFLVLMSLFWISGILAITYHEPKISDFIFKKFSPKVNDVDSNLHSRE